MLRVGLSGGIGSGKSSVARFWQTLGIPVYDSDSRARGIMNSDVAVVSAISELFGSQAYTDGALNREYIASRVFSDRGLLQKLNQIVHPAVQNDFCKWSEEQNSPYVVEETALLFDGGENSISRTMDFNVVVVADLSVRVRRASLRDKVSEQKILERINNQMAQEDMIAEADFCIDNNSQLIIPQIIAIDNAIRNSLAK